MRDGQTATLGLELHGLYDCARIARDLGIKRATAEKYMRACRTVQRAPDSRKVFVRGDELQRVLDEYLEQK